MIISNVNYNRYEGITYTVQHNNKEYYVLLSFKDAYVKVNKHKTRLGRTKYENTFVPSRMIIYVTDRRGKYATQDLDNIVNLETVVIACIESAK